MNQPETIPPAKYILESFEPASRIAVLALNRDFRETVQRITSAEKAASPEFQAWLRHKNASGSDIYVTWNRTGWFVLPHTTSSIGVHTAWPVLVAGSTARGIALQHSSLRARIISFAFSKTSP